MGVIIYSVNLNISPKMSYGVLESDIVMLQNYMLMILQSKILQRTRGVICAGPSTGMPNSAVQHQAGMTKPRSTAFH